MNEQIIIPSEENSPRRLPRRLAAECLAIALLVKLAVFLFCAFQFPFEKHPNQTVLSIWKRWDAVHYLQIAETWYDSGAISPEAHQFISHFPPFFPLVVRLIQFVTQLTFLQAGMLSALLTGLATAYLLANICWLEFQDRRVVLRTVFLFHLYPTSYVLIAPYSEGLFFVCAFSVFLFLRHVNNLFLASLSFSLALAARFTGITLGAAFLWELWSKGTSNWKNRLFAVAAGPILVMSGIFLLNEVTWGDPFFFLRYNFNDPGNQRYLILPLSETFSSLWDLCLRLFDGTLDSQFIYTLGASSFLTFFVLAVTGIGFFWKLVPATYSIFAFAYILFYASFHWGISNARYSFCAFPVFFVLAQIRQPVLFWTLATLFGATLLTFSLHFVSGFWTF